MDSGRTLITRLAAALLSSVAMAAAGAHPHSEIEQQVFLALGTDSVGIQVRIAPSYTEGAAIFTHIDGDGDGSVSPAEADRFGLQVLSGAVLSVDGRRLPLSAARVQVPDMQSISAGLGLIEIDAVAAMRMSGDSRHVVDFEIAYDDLAHEWFVQPFYYPALLRFLPSQSFERSDSGRRVEIRLAP